MVTPQTGGSGLATAIRVSSAAVVLATSIAATAISVHDHDRISVVVDTNSVPSSGAASTTSQQPAQQLAPTPLPPHGAPGAPAGPSSAVRLGTGIAVPAAVPLNPGTHSGVSVPGAPAAGTPGGAVALIPGAAGLFDDTAATPQPPCPLGWPAPQHQGGLASLIGLAPMAGPFSSEAFALGSVYQPILRLAGPVLAELQPLLIRLQPIFDPIIAQAQAVEEIVLEAILPYYGPYRQQLISAEGDVAKWLAPMLDRMYHTEAASCLVAWEGQLITAAKGGPITVASLARPGTTVQLEPKR